MPTSTVWVGGLAPNITEDMLDRHFGRYGRIKGLGLDRKRGYCMVSFEHIAGSTSAHNELKERNLFGKRVRVRNTFEVFVFSGKILQCYLYHSSHSSLRVILRSKSIVIQYLLYIIVLTRRYE